MVYECDQCGAALSPGIKSCPKCGEIFEHPVPDDAEQAQIGFSAVAADQHTSEQHITPEPQDTPQQRRQAHLVNRSATSQTPPPSGNSMGSIVDEARRLNEGGSGASHLSSSASTPRPAVSLTGVYLLLLVIAGLLLALVLHVPAQGVVRPQWEYTLKDVPDADFTDQMNEMGKDGWDVVTARRASDGNDTPTFSYEIVFKRAKQ